MKTVCLYFQVHQPWRLKKYRFFNMGKDHNYLDDLTNRSIMQKIARECYLPMNALLFNLIRQSEGRFRCTFSLTGLAVEQMRAYAPEVLDSFRRLARTGCVEFLAETYSHSLASLASKEDFTEQVKLHTNLIKKEFGMKPTAFRNTELIYSDQIGETVAQMGFKTILAEGAKHVLGWKSPNYVYANAVNQKLRLLLRNYKLSDDIAFRFSNRSSTGGKGAYTPDTHYIGRASLRYDADGNICEVQAVGQPPICYLWGYKGQYLVAEIRNAAYDEVTTALGAATVERIRTSVVLSEGDLAALDGLRTSRKEWHVTTATYIPLVGMASMTDPSGRETTYEYNAHNHLMRVRDHKGKVVNEYEYSFDQ